ncbi:MAG: hypothetical protein JSR62_00310 [Nitrospira sp.]|nr:hypothetical protein [Nitrospira sp.]
MLNMTHSIFDVRIATRLFISILCLALHAWWVPSIAASAAPTLTDHSQQGQIDIEFSLSAVNGTGGTSVPVEAGNDALATLRLRDLRTGRPLTGLSPKAWMALRRSEMVAGETACADKVRNFLGGNLSARADVDLNSSLLFVLNHDKTISVINPLIALSRTKLENMIQLPGDGSDWVLSRDKNHLYVTIPDQATVSVIDTRTRKIESQIPTGAESQPRRIALHPNGRYIWVGLDGSEFVAVIDTTRNELTTKVHVGRGLHAIAFTSDGRYALITNSESDSVSIVDTTNWKPSHEIAVGKTPVAVATSLAGGRGYVASLNDNYLAVIDVQNQDMLSAISTKPGTTVVHMEPEGRFLFALNQLTSTVSVVDTTTNKIALTSSVVKEPDQVSFTKQFAYIRGLGSEKVSLIELGELRKGRLVPVEVQIGQSAPAALPDQIGVAAMMAPALEGHGMMIASAPDKTIYYYMEGMMVPMGTFQTYQRFPRALIAVDRGLTETAPGSYSTTVHLSKESGRFDVPVFIDHPRVMTCVQVTVRPSPEMEHKRSKNELTIESLFADKDITADSPTALRFRVTETATKQPVSGIADLQVLVFQPPGTWQHRGWARDLGNGLYEVSEQFPRGGQYQVMVRVPSKGLTFDSKSQVALTVHERSKSGSVSDRAAKRD